MSVSSHLSPTKMLAVGCRICLENPGLSFLKSFIIASKTFVSNKVTLIGSGARLWTFLFPGHRSTHCRLHSLYPLAAGSRCEFPGQHKGCLFAVCPGKGSAPRRGQPHRLAGVLYKLYSVENLSPEAHDWKPDSLTTKTRGKCVTDILISNPLHNDSSPNP